MTRQARGLAGKFICSDPNERGPSNEAQPAAALQRFLAARKFDVEAAALMIEQHLAWRAATLPVELTSEVEAELRKGKFFVTPFRDLDGRPILHVRNAYFVRGGSVAEDICNF